jgi:phytoene dehydrogenase-like protein
MSEPWYDAVVVGAGFGGLATALELAQRGARVALCESLNYPGGCASTFRRDGYAFEAGATLFSGLAEQQLFGQWVRRYGLGVEVDWIDPLVELRTPSLRLAVHRDRERFVEQLTRLPDAPVRGRLVAGGGLGVPRAEHPGHRARRRPDRRADRTPPVAPPRVLENGKTSKACESFKIYSRGKRNNVPV